MAADTYGPFAAYTVCFESVAALDIQHTVDFHFIRGQISPDIHVAIAFKKNGIYVSPAVKSSVHQQAIRSEAAQTFADAVYPYLAIFSAVKSADTVYINIAHRFKVLSAAVLRLKTISTVQVLAKSF
jgi:hypothetical protein